MESQLNKSKSTTMLYLNIGLVVFVILAFGIAAFVQPFRQERYIKPVVLIHILASMGWLILLVYQSKLALNNKLNRHKKNELIGTMLVLISLVSSIYIVFDWGSAQRLVAESRDVLVFALFFFLAIDKAKKGKFEHHKHFMLFAALNLINPAIARVYLMMEGPIYVGVLMSVLIWILVPIIYDLITAKHILKITLNGIVITMVSYVLMIALALSPLIKPIEIFLYGDN